MKEFDKAVLGENVMKPFEVAKRYAVCVASENSVEAGFVRGEFAETFPDSVPADLADQLFDMAVQVHEAIELKKSGADAEAVAVFETVLKERSALRSHPDVKNNASAAVFVKELVKREQGGAAASLDATIELHNDGSVHEPGAQKAPAKTAPAKTAGEWLLPSLSQN